MTENNIIDREYFAGIDVGASTTKAVIIDGHNRVLGTAITRSGADFKKAAEKVFDNALEEAGLTRGDITCTISTGYGRNNVEFAKETKTEISCHAKGAYFHFPYEITVIDIGGQDNKVIKLDGNGKKKSFKMNRKCAAGTGAFLEEIAYKLDLPLDRLDSMARASTEIVELGSFCTVFTSTEILGRIKEGKKAEDLIRGAFRSVVRRLLEMESIDGKVVMTGGVVEHNPFITETLKEFCHVEVMVPPRPQFMGAFGAALYASSLCNRSQEK